MGMGLGVLDRGSQIVEEPVGYLLLKSITR
jgi:hypothetical protein